MSHVDELQTKAAARVREILARPMPADGDSLGIVGEFNPWDVLSSLYGSYNSDFDKLAIEVLCDVRDGTYKRYGLAQEIFREMLCTAELCSYGTSPRTCFPTGEFAALLPELIERWRIYADMAWGRPVTEAK